MGYPSVEYEAHIRNTLSNTIEFLKRRHSPGRVKVFNLRGGYFYDPAMFDNNVITFDMTDHHPPRLELMAPFCREAKEWLDAHPENVIAVHCKAGKGRTGVMICALLVYITFYNCPRQILDYYSIIRTKNNKGVTIPSQRRYIYYYAKLRELSLNYFPIRVQFLGVYVECPPNTNRLGLGGGSSRIKIQVTNYDQKVFASSVLELTGRAWREEKFAWRSRRSEGNERQFDPTSETNTKEDYVCRRGYCFMVDEDEPVFVEGDVRVDLLSQKNFAICGPPIQKFSKIGHVWFNTMFTCRGALTREIRPDEKKGKTIEEIKKLEDELIEKAFFEYGDRKAPYEEGETSIAKRRLREEDVLVYPENARKPRPDVGDLKILKPPAIDVHTPPETIRTVYKNFGTEEPRHENTRVLYQAHARGIVKDDYNIRRKKASAGEPVDLAPERPVTGTSGPMSIRYEEGQHILSFPVYEMDRALKDHHLDDRLKIHIVLKCVDSSDPRVMERSEVCCNLGSANASVNEHGTHASRPKFPCQKPREDSNGAEKQFPPAVRYSDSRGQYDGKPHPNLEETESWDWRAGHSLWSRYFYKQRRDSVSEYKGTTHICSLTNKKFQLIDHENRRDDDHSRPPSFARPSRQKRSEPQSSTSEPPPPDQPAPAPSSSSNPPRNGGSEETRPFSCRLAEPEQYPEECSYQMSQFKNACKNLLTAQNRFAGTYGRYKESDQNIEMQSFLDTDEYNKFTLGTIDFDQVPPEMQPGPSRIGVQETHDEFRQFAGCSEEPAEEGDVDHFSAVIATLEGLALEEQREERARFEFDRERETARRNLERTEIYERAMLKSIQAERHTDECIDKELLAKLNEEREAELKRLRTLHSEPGTYQRLVDMRDNPDNLTQEERESGIDAQDPQYSQYLPPPITPKIIVTEARENLEKIKSLKRSNTI